jgi:hypothetical protein
VSPVALVLAFFSVMQFPLDLTPNQGNAIVRGTVNYSVTHQPVGGAIVFATSPVGVQSTTADDKGNFYFLTLLPGDYRFSGGAVGYEDHCMCCRQNPKELDAGFEYVVTVWLVRACY